jgi:ComF family protein
MILRTLGVGLLEAVFPPACAACPDVGREPFCRLCAEALEAAGPFTVEGAEAAAAAFSYGGPVAEAVQHLKYGGRWALGRGLGAALAPLLASLPPVELAVPVPLSRARLVARGYNQARELCRGLPLPVRPRALVRRHGQEQVGLGREARRANLLEAMGPGPQSVAGARVLLVDDVVTTGATAEAATAALRAAGAKAVVVLALAHTPRRDDEVDAAGT